MEQIDKLIKDYRSKHGLSMQRLSDITGIPKDRLYKWEKGHTPYMTSEVETFVKFLKGENVKFVNVTNIEPHPPTQPTTTGDNPHTETIEYLKEIIQTQKTVIDDLKELVELYKQKPAPDFVPKKTHSKT